MLSEAERKAVKLAAAGSIRLTDGLRQAVADDLRVVVAVLHILARQMRGLVEMDHRGVVVREDRLREVAEAVLHSVSLTREAARKAQALSGEGSRRG